MPFIPCAKIVGLSFFGAFKKHIVIGIAGRRDGMLRRYERGRRLDEAHHGLHLVRLQFELFAAQYILVLGEDRRGDKEFAEGRKRDLEDQPLSAVGLEYRR